MDLKRLTRLDREHINLLRNIPLKENSFKDTSTLFYEGQTPIVAYLVIQGSITLLKNKKIKASLKAGALFGLKELIQNAPVPLEARVAPNTQLIFLDKSTIYEILCSGYGADLSMIFRHLMDT